MRILVCARGEIEEACGWYEAQAPGLGERFMSEFEHGLKRVQEFPRAWHPIKGNIRRYRMGRFPYGILYAVEEQGILVLAVAHLHRAPRHWRTGTE